MVSNLSFMLPIITKWFYIHTNTYYFIIRDHSDKSHEYKEHICTRYLIKNMVTPLLAESIRSKRGKDKFVILGFIYTLNKSNKELNHWVCENRGHCKARISTTIDMKPRDSNEILDSHTHGPDISRIEMLKGYNLLKECASSNSDESTRAIFASGVETMSDTSITKLPKTE